MATIPLGSLTIMSAILSLIVNIVLGEQAACINGLTTEQTRKVPSTADRIVGGNEITITDAPIIVSIRNNGQHMCGGSVLSPLFILTAGHCCQVAVSGLTVNAGSTYSNADKQVRSVENFTVHPEYSVKFPYDFDCCVVKLKAPLDITSDCKPVGLADNSTILDATATVIGWGLVKESGKAVSVPLKSVVVPIVSQSECQKSYGTTIISNTMLCAGDQGMDSCQGDSGGPMLNAKGIQIGIVSWGKGCGRQLYPGVYAKVSACSEWILAQASGAANATVVIAARLGSKQA